jgi:hypothetical protein
LRSIRVTSGIFPAKLNILVADTVYPEATVLFDKEAYNAGEDINAVITATDNYGVAKIDCDFDGTKIEVDGDGRITIPDNQLGEYLMTVEVNDVFGNKYTLLYRFYVQSTGTNDAVITCGVKIWYLGITIDGTGSLSCFNYSYLHFLYLNLM